MEGFVAAVAPASTKTASTGRSIARSDHIELDVEALIAEIMPLYFYLRNNQCDLHCLRHCTGARIAHASRT